VKSTKNLLMKQREHEHVDENCSKIESHSSDIKIMHSGGSFIT
jgi:hypothetical protein